MCSTGINVEELRGQPANPGSPGKWPLKQSVCYMLWAIRRGLTNKTDHQTLYNIIIQLKTRPVCGLCAM